MKKSHSKLLFLHRTNLIEKPAVGNAVEGASLDYTVVDICTRHGGNLVGYVVSEWNT